MTSRTLHERHTAQGKRAYEHRQDAKRAARQVTSRNGTVVRVYQCAGEADSCGRWFVGRPRKTERQRALWPLPPPDRYLTHGGRRPRAQARRRADHDDLPDLRPGRAVDPED